MQASIFWVVCILPFIASEQYELQSNRVCFRTKGSHFGTFKTSLSGVIESIKLVHISGQVQCHGSSNGISNFGCGGTKLMTVITDEKNSVLFPESSKLGWYGEYTIKGYTSTSHELILKNKVTNPYVEKGQELRIWYGEDLKKYYEGDNRGESCVKVYARIRPAEFKLQRRGVCFSAKGDNPGSFKIKESGMLTNIKLVWKTGSVDCHWGGGSHWGCYSKLGVVLSSADKKVIFPKPDINGWIAYYKRPRYDVHSKKLILDNPEYNPIVKAGQTLQLWYGEDLFNYWEFDNHGRVCADVYAAVTSHEFALQKENVCFGAKGSSYAKFQTSTGGRLQSIKLKYRSGYVSCWPAKYASYRSHFGCGGKTLNTLITNSQDKVIFPATYKSGGEYTIPGYTSQSNEIILNNPHKITKVEEGQQLRIWYGEDLFNHYEGNNPYSKTCVDVYALIASKKSLRCYGQDNGCCTAETPCEEGEGDCDEDNECAEGLTCGNSNCPWGDKDDCCMAPPQDSVSQFQSEVAKK